MYERGVTKVDELLIGVAWTSHRWCALTGDCSGPNLGHGLVCAICSQNCKAPRREYRLVQCFLKGARSLVDSCIVCERFRMNLLTCSTMYGISIAATDSTAEGCGRRERLGEIQWLVPQTCSVSEDACSYSYPALRFFWFTSSRLSSLSPQPSSIAKTRRLLSSTTSPSPSPAPVQLTTIPSHTTTKPKLARHTNNVETRR